MDSDERRWARTSGLGVGLGVGTAALTGDSRSVRERDVLRGLVSISSGASKL